MGRSVPELPDGKPDFHIQDLLVNGTTRVSLKIRNQTSGQGSVIESLAGATQPQQWVRTRVRRVVPVTKLLPDDLQNNIESLYSKLLSYHPIYFDGIGEHGGSFDGTSHALKTISSIVVQSSGFIHSLTVSYQDGSFSEQYGGPSNRKHTFQLRSGESVVEVLVWREPSLEAMSGIQFITSLGRVSPHYGGHGGIPTVLRSTDGCLVAFCGRSINHSEAKETNMIDQLQAIWRHDIMKTPEFQYSDYLGGSGGFPFNDRVFVGASGAGFIKSIRVNCSVDDVQSWCVENIQIEYAVSSSGSTNYSMGPSHGGVKAQKEMLFELEPGEHITAALGWANDWISQISFATNKGRVSPLCGQEQGTAFRCQAPVSEHGGLMRLSHIVGKSGNWLNGLLFVWAPP
ncbi:Protein MICROTUBULE BINDING PROTEIN 2C [Ceratobasidium sp. 428]|nr:Protein MICROTUBULE BINDING PROTEIN 2C [Ceratobasidium sp. 428]